MSAFFQKNAFEDVTREYHTKTSMHTLTFNRDCSITSQLDGHRTWLLPYRCLSSFFPPYFHPDLQLDEGVSADKCEEYHGLPVKFQFEPEDKIRTLGCHGACEFAHYGLWGAAESQYRPELGRTRP